MNTFNIFVFITCNIIVIMHTLFRSLAVLYGCFILNITGLPVNCPSSPAEWCGTRAIAAACGVRLYLIRFFPINFVLSRLQSNVQRLYGIIQQMIVLILRFIMNHYAPIAGNSLSLKSGLLIKLLLTSLI